MPAADVDTAVIDFGPGRFVHGCGGTVGSSGSAGSVTTRKRILNLAPCLAVTLALRGVTFAVYPGTGLTVAR